MMRVAILAYEGCWGLSVFTAADVFRVAVLLERHLGREPSFTVSVLSPDGADVMCASGQVIRSEGALDETAYDLVVVPAVEGTRLSQPPDARLVSWLADHIRAESRVLALTTAAGLVAATGLADGRLLATHWAFARGLGKRYPQCCFTAHPSFLYSKNLYTTGSLNGGFDALLDILARVRGDVFAQLCATHLLAADPQRLPPILPGRRNHADTAVLAVQDHIEARYAEALTIADLARHAGLTERTLKRRFMQATGLAPNQYLQQVRIDKAKKLLIATDMAVKEAAYAVGYDNVSFFVRLFKTSVGVTPGVWRQVSHEPSAKPPGRTFS